MYLCQVSGYQTREPNDSALNAQRFATELPFFLKDMTNIRHFCLYIKYGTYTFVLPASEGIEPSAYESELYLFLFLLETGPNMRHFSYKVRALASCQQHSESNPGPCDYGSTPYR